MLKLGLALGALALTTALASAQTNAPPPARSSSGPTEASSQHGTRGHRAHDSQSLKALQAAKITLAQAIDAAEARTPGRAIEADFEVENNVGQYEIKMLGADGKLVEHHVDATSGQVTKSENHRIESFFTRLKPADVQNARTSLKQAIATAEQKAGGRATKAEIEREASSLRYKITVANGDRTQEVNVDVNGQIVSQN